MENPCRNPKQMLTIAGGVTLGIIGYQIIRFLYLVGIEVLWKAGRLVD